MMGKKQETDGMDLGVGLYLVVSVLRLSCDYRLLISV